LLGDVKKSPARVSFMDSRTNTTSAAAVPPTVTRESANIKIINEEARDSSPTAGSIKRNEDTRLSDDKQF